MPVSQTIKGFFFCGGPFFNFWIRLSGPRTSVILTFFPSFFSNRTVLLIIYRPVSSEERRPAVAPSGHTRLSESSQAHDASFQRCRALSAVVPPV